MRSLTRLYPGPDVAELAELELELADLEPLEPLSGPSTIPAPPMALESETPAEDFE